MKTHFFIKCSLTVNLFWVLTLTASKAIAQSVQSSNTMKHHVVVLIDRSGSVRSNISDEDRANLLGKALPNYLFEPGTINRLNRPMLDDGDYLSILSFGFNRDNPSVDDFIEIKQGSNKFGYRYLEKYTPDNFRQLARKYGAQHSFFNKNWTGLSFAGALSLEYLKFNNQPKDINRTFVIIVTDGVSNNVDDPNNEITSIGRGEKSVFVRGKETIIPKYQKIRESFIWHNIFTYPSGSENDNKKYKFVVWEYVPLQKTFAIEALIPLPSELTFIRTPHGFYANDLKLTPYKNNKDFKIQKLVLSGYDSTQGQSIFEQEYNYVYNDTSISLDIKNDYGKNELYIKAQFWVHFNDGAYGAHTLHPMGSELQGSLGLNRLIKVNIEPQASIYGFLPLWDLLYLPLSGFYTDQYAVARIWEVALPILLLITILVLFKLKSNITKPDKKVEV